MRVPVVYRNSSTAWMTIPCPLSHKDRALHIPDPVEKVADVDHATSTAAGSAVTQSTVSQQSYSG